MVRDSAMWCFVAFQMPLVDRWSLPNVVQMSWFRSSLVGFDIMLDSDLNGDLTAQGQGFSGTVLRS
jgi:hypothetical protein